MKKYFPCSIIFLIACAAYTFPFSVSGVSLTLLSPKGGEVFSQGSSISIRWASEGAPQGSLISIYLYKSEAFPPIAGESEWVANIAYRVVNDGEEVWTIPAVVAPGKNYFLEMHCYDPFGRDGYICGSDDDNPNFTITVASAVSNISTKPAILSAPSSVQAFPSDKKPVTINPTPPKDSLGQGQPPAYLPTTAQAGFEYRWIGTFERMLRRGMRGEDISELQKLLSRSLEIYPEGIVTGFFGPLTQAAIERLQKKYTIVISGSPETTGYGQVGPRTRLQLNQLLTLDASSIPLAPGVSKFSFPLSQQSAYPPVPSSLSLPPTLNAMNQQPATSNQQPVPSLEATTTQKSPKVPVPIMGTNAVPPVSSSPQTPTTSVQQFATGPTSSTTPPIQQTLPPPSPVLSQSPEASSAQPSGTSSQQLSPRDQQSIIPAVELFDTTAGAPRTASILQVPLPEYAHCFVRNAPLSDPLCAAVRDRGVQAPSCTASKSLFNPVYDESGVLYPSACWAEKYGVLDYRFGISERVKNFVRDLWDTPKEGPFPLSFDVPSPDVEFSYNAGFVGDVKSEKDGPSLMSTIWTGKEYLNLEYNIATNFGAQKSTSLYVNTGTSPVSKPIFAATRKLLLVFVRFGEPYPEAVLKDWAREYGSFINDVLRKKQNVSDPIQFAFEPVVIDAPSGITYANSCRASDPKLGSDRDRVISAALAKIGKSKNDFQNIGIVYFTIANAYDVATHGGYMTRWNNMPLVFAHASLKEPYTEDDPQRYIKAVEMFTLAFNTLGHELMHSLGANHRPWATETYIDSNGFSANNEIDEQYKCRTLASENNGAYSVKLPARFNLTTSNNPSWARTIESSSGSCLGIFGQYSLFADQNSIIKDFDRDGDYEFVFGLDFSDLVHAGTRRSLGWLDIDGDGVSELMDPSPYGGYKERKFASYTLKERTEPLFFEPLGEREIDGCRYERIRLSNGVEGFAPLECREYNQDTVNLYQGVKYIWIKISESFGTVLLARLPSGSDYSAVSSESECASKDRYGHINGAIEGALKNKETACELTLIALPGAILPSGVGALSRLKVLKVGSSLSEISSEIWGLLTLQRLAFLNNNFSLSYSGIERLQNLQELTLNRVALSEFPPHITQLSSLRILDLNGNLFPSLPKEIGELRNLEWINISSNRNIRALPPEIGSLERLEFLLADFAAITELPKEIGNLSRLKGLYLYTSKLTKLPETFSNLTQLRELGLNANPLETLPIEITKLENLLWLDLTRTQLTSLPAEIGNLTKLRDLDLRENDLTELPKELLKLSNLRNLYLTGNPLSEEEKNKIRELLPNTNIIF